jgi:hypothetical protein
MAVVLNVKGCWIFEVVRSTELEVGVLGGRSGGQGYELWRRVGTVMPIILE